MRVIYSIGAKFGGYGVGHAAYHAASGIYSAGWLERLFVNSNAQTLIPNSHIRQWGLIGRVFKYIVAKEPSGLTDHLLNVLFDGWVAVQMSDADIFHGWNGLCLHSLRAAKHRGMKTVVERASAHPQTYVQLMQEEYARWNVPLRLPKWNYPRLLHEFEETDYITVPSRFARESMLAEGVPAEKLVEIPFGVDLERFSPTRNVSSPTFRVIYAGNISINKGVPYLLEAWHQLGWNDAQLWIVGTILPDFGTIRQRWSHLKNVDYLPHSKELPRLLQQSDIFVFPSIQEGSALVTYETMAAGLPVITTPNAGSVVRDGVDGFIVPIRDIDALAARMNELRADAALCQRMGAAARSRAEGFSWNNYRGRLLEMYGQFRH